MIERALFQYVTRVGKYRKKAKLYQSRMSRKKSRGSVASQTQSQHQTPQTTNRRSRTVNDSLNVNITNNNTNFPNATMGTSPLHLGRRAQIYDTGADSDSSWESQLDSGLTQMKMKICVFFFVFLSFFWEVNVGCVRCKKVKQKQTKN